jgi:colicin import membrane protein
MDEWTTHRTTTQPGDDVPDDWPEDDVTARDVPRPSAGDPIPQPEPTPEPPQPPTPVPPQPPAPPTPIPQPPPPPDQPPVPTAILESARAVAGRIAAHAAERRW